MTRWVKVNMRDFVLRRLPYFFARIENIFRIKDFFGLCKQPQNFGSEHGGEVWRAHQAIIVFAGDRAFILGDQRKNFCRKLRYDRAQFFVADVVQGNDMKISIPRMPRNGKRKVIVGHDFLEPRQKFW